MRPQRADRGASPAACCAACRNRDCDGRGTAYARDVNLSTCSQCHRHVATTENACPFCGAITPGAARVTPRSTSGRLSRATVFAGAALASPACWTPKSTPPPTAIDQHQVVPADSGVIAGTVIGFTSRKPLAGTRVVLKGPIRPDVTWGEQRTVETQTDSSGRFSFASLPAGDYAILVTLDVARDTRVSLAAGRHLDLTMEVYEGDPRNMATPYGAPPARRRTV
jgi:hypothetical protein